MLVILLIGVERAFLPSNDVALDRVDIDSVRFEMIEDAALLKDDEIITLALLMEVVSLEVVVVGRTENEDAVSLLHEACTPLLLDDVEDNGVVVASPRAATAPIIHMVVQIIVVWGLE